jgi:Zn-dependent peptidase ImmA (M78 family)/DNA-binding XRE family transcriptional regulator
MTGASFQANISPEFFVWARLSSGYTEDDLAKAAGVHRQAWEAWEAGKAKPTFRQLENVARKCKRPLAAFYLPKPPALEQPPEDFRHLPNGISPAYQPETLLAFRVARRLQRSAPDLLERPARPASERIPLATIKDDPEAVGGTLRAQLGLPFETQVAWADGYAAYRAWRAAIERQGVLTFQFGIPLTDARGFSLWDEQYPAVVASSKDAVTARCFTVLHELAHLVIRRPGVSPHEWTASAPDERQRVESFCNRTAAAVLLPLSEDTVRERLRHAINGHLDLGAVSAAAYAFKVSRETVVWRMVDAGLIEASQAAGAKLGWDVQHSTEEVEVDEKRKPGGGPLPEVRRLAERGPTLTAAVLEALDDGRISPSDAVDYLDLPQTRFERLRARLLGGPPAKADA